VKCVNSEGGGIKGNYKNYKIIIMIIIIIIQGDTKAGTFEKSNKN